MVPLTATALGCEPVVVRQLVITSRAHAEANPHASLLVLRQAKACEPADFAGRHASFRAPFALNFARLFPFFDPHKLPFRVF